MALFALTRGAQGQTPDVYTDPMDDFSMPGTYVPRDFYTLSRLFAEGGDSTWMAQHFNHWDLSVTTREGQPWVDWRFNKKDAATKPILVYRHRTRISPYQYSIRVFNAGAQAINLSGVTDCDLQDWVLVKPGEEGIVTAQGSPMLVAQNVDPNAEYRVLLRDLTIHYPQAAGLSLTKLEAPAQWMAGSRIQFQLQLGGELEQQVIDLEVGQEPWVYWRIRLTAEELARLATQAPCTVERDVPWYLSPGEVDYCLVADGYRIKGAEGRARIDNATQAELPRMERREYQGRPTFFRNGEPFIWTGYATYNYQPGAVQAFGNSGANVFFIPTDAGRHVHNIAAPTDMGGGEFDFGELEQYVTTALQANPDANLMMRVSLCPPPTWFSTHPDSLVRIRTEKGDEIWEETSSKVPTLTSLEWREYQTEAFKKLIHYCATRPWASRVIGFFPSCGVTEEWFAWACNDGKFSDYSPANEQAFREWCKAKGYPYDRIPDPALRSRPGYDLFPSDEQGRWAAAYNAFLTESTADTIRYFTSLVKQETGRRSLAGILYGYVVQCSGEPRQSTSGNFGLQGLIESPDIDFFTGIPLHTFRDLTGDGFDTYPTAADSMQAHGKLYNNEDDLFSWLHNAVWYREYDPADPRGGAISMHRRVLANDAVHGAPRQWFSLSATWHHDRQLQEEFATQIKLHGEALKFDRTSADEVALVIDDSSFVWLTPESKFLLYANHFMLGALGRTGASVGIWLLSDVDRLPDSIKFVVVVNSIAPTPADLQKLKTCIERGGRTIMVVGLPGLVDTQTRQWNTNGPAQVMGLPIQVDDTLSSAGAVLSATGQWLCNMTESIRPRGVLAEPGLMKYADGKTAGAERPLAAGGRLIWCAVPPHVDSVWLREQMQQAGVHCYAPSPCSVHASRELVAITSVYADDREIELQWPEDVQVTDLYDGWTGRGKSFACPFRHGQTRLFRVTRP